MGVDGGISAVLFGNRFDNFLYMKAGAKATMQCVAPNRYAPAGSTAVYWQVVSHVY